MTPLPLAPTFLSIALFLSGLSFSQEKPKSHEPEKQSTSSRPVADGIYAKKPEVGRDEKQEALLKEVRENYRKFKELEQAIELLGWQIRNAIRAGNSIAEIEQRFKLVHDKMKSPLGVSPEEAAFFKKKELAIKLAKEWEILNPIIYNANPKLAELAVGKEICNRIYAKGLIDRSSSLLHESKREKYENNAGVMYSMKSSDGSYYTTCEFPGKSSANESTIFILHFNKDLKLVEVFQPAEDRFTYDFVPVDFALERKKVRLNALTEGERSVLVLSKKSENRKEDQIVLKHEENKDSKEYDERILERNGKSEKFSFEGFKHFGLQNEFRHPD